MPTTAPSSCPSCGKNFRLPEDSGGKKVRCSNCRAVLHIVAGDDGLRLETAEPAPAPPPSAAQASACPSCGGAIAAGDTFCNQCGGNLAEVTEREARKTANRELSADRRNRRGQADRKKKIVSASGILLLLACLLVIFGTIQGFSEKRDADAARANLAGLAADELLEINGQEMTVAQLHKAIDFEVVMVFAVNYLLAATMLGLYFWARKSPFPALLTGLCLYLVLVVVNAVIDPKTLAQGIILKVIVISGMIGGMNAALAQRAVARGDGAGTTTARRSRRARSA